MKDRNATAPAATVPRPTILVDDTEPRGSKRVMAYATEAIVALGLALIFFAVFLGLLTVIFPASVRLRDLVGPGVVRSTEPAEVPTEVAHLTVLHSDMRARPSGAIAWGPATNNLGLRNQDAIQTLSNGRGLVVFRDGDNVRIEKNSLMIIGAKESAQAAATPGPDMMMVDGEIWGSLRLEADERMNVMLPGGAVQLVAGSNNAAEFRVAVQHDKSASVAVYRGDADISAQGRSVHLSANQGTRVSADGAVAPARDLAIAPRQLAPVEGASFEYGTFPPRVLFQWSKVANADEYRIVVARDRDQKDVVLDKRLAGTELLCGQLKQGHYFWRVSSLRDDLEGSPSAWSGTRTFQSNGPPELDVDEVAKIVSESPLTIHGKTEPGCRVVIDGHAIEVASDGQFEDSLTLEPGANVLTIESIDSAGSASYWTRVVHLKP